MDKFISVIASPLPFILLISVVITVHELGHYWVGRFFGAAVESFSIGFGKPIFQVTDRRGTRWRINWLPLGGFVKFVGEMQAPQDSKEDNRRRSEREPNGGETAAMAAATYATEQPVHTSTPKRRPPMQPIGRAYTQIGPLSRLAVSLGGPFANFLFAIVVYAAMGLALGVPTANEVRVHSVTVGGPAEAAGFQPGDTVLTAGGRPVETSNDLIRATMLAAGEPVTYTVRRAGEELSLTAIPVEQTVHNEALNVTEKIGRIGLAPENVGVSIKRLNPIEALGYGVKATEQTLSNTLTALRRLVTGLDGLDKLSGPVGIFSITDKVTDSQLKQADVPFAERFRGAMLALVELAAILSIGVGFFNLLPIPVLDGGAAVMCLAEATMRREVPEKVQRIGLTIGFAFLVSFALVITWNDLAKLFWPGGPT